MFYENEHKLEQIEETGKDLINCDILWHKCVTISKFYRRKLQIIQQLARVRFRVESRFGKSRLIFYWLYPYDKEVNTS